MTQGIISFSVVSEEDGNLVYFESNSLIPFEIKRVFSIYGIPSTDVVRANHASMNTSFVLQATSGSVQVELENATGKQKYDLNCINEGLLVPKMTWMRTTNFSKDAVLTVYASETYNTCQYINNYDEFLKLVNENEKDSNSRCK